MIYRAEHRTDFVRISWSSMRDERLSFEARGLLAFIMTLPDKWEFSINGLSVVTNSSNKTIMRLVKELKSAGYVKQTKIKDKSGHFSSYEWSIFEAPELPENGTSAKGSSEAPNYPKTELPSDRTSVKPNFRKRETKNEIYIKNEITKKNEISIKRDETISDLLEPLSSDLRDTFLEFIKMRKTIKAPMTEKALDLAIKKALKLGDGDEVRAKAIVEQSIMNSWKGLFPLKDEIRRARPEPIHDDPFDKYIFGEDSI